jgi:hypothetical protein
VTYWEGEPFTTRDKKVDVSKAVRDLKHSPKVPLVDGLALTLEWMEKYYTPVLDATLGEGVVHTPERTKYVQKVE